MGRMKLDQNYDENVFIDEFEDYETSFEKRRPLKMKKDFKEKVKEKISNNKKELYEFVKSNEKIEIK